MNRKTLLALTTVFLGTTLALAQLPGPGGQQGQGGQRQPGQIGGRQGGMFGGGPMLLLRQDVQKELNLSQTQITKVQELIRSLAPQGGQRQPGQPPDRERGDQGQRRQGGMQDAMRENQEKMEKGLKEILNATQFNRYRELDLQFARAQAVLRPDISKELGLNETQINRIREILRQNMEQMREQFQQGGGQRDPQAMAQAREANRKKLNDSVLGVLNASQKDKWQKMLGKPFTFQNNVR